MPIKNEAMLITYSDSMGKNIKETHEVLKNYIGDAIGGVHLLPFFPSTGDRGFAPYRYDVVDSAFGNWDDVEALGEDYYLMFDFMINHLKCTKTSRRSTMILSTTTSLFVGKSSGKKLVRTVQLKKMLT